MGYYKILLVLTFLTIKLATISGQTNQSHIAEKTERSPQGRIKCYQCNSIAENQSDCTKSDLSLLDKYITGCPPLRQGKYAGKEANSCRKVVQNVLDDQSIVRECAYVGDEPVHGKRRTGNKGVLLHLYQCFNENNEKPCNSSTTLRINTMLLSLSLLVFFSYRFKA